MNYSVERHYERLMRNPHQPRRSVKEVRGVALDELRKRGLSRRIKVRVTKTISHPQARAEYIRRGNIMKLHPINRFALKGDLRQTVQHEISRFRDESRPDRTKEY